MILVIHKFFRDHSIAINTFTASLVVMGGFFGWLGNAWGVAQSAATAFFVLGVMLFFVGTHLRRKEKHEADGFGEIVEGQQTGRSQLLNLTVARQFLVAGVAFIIGGMLLVLQMYEPVGKAEVHFYYSSNLETTSTSILKQLKETRWSIDVNNSGLRSCAGLTQHNNSVRYFREEDKWLAARLRATILRLQAFREAGLKGDDALTLEAHLDLVGKRRQVEVWMCGTTIVE